METVFEKLDSDRNGFVDSREIVDVLNGNFSRVLRQVWGHDFSRQIENFMEYYDVNRDSRLELEEFKVAMRQLSGSLAHPS